MTHFANPDMLLIAREMRELTQKMLAEISEIGQDRISRYENGESPIPQEDLDALAKALSFPVSFFLRDGKRHSVDMGAMFHRQQYSLPAAIQKRLDSELENYFLNATELLKRVNPENIHYHVPQFRIVDFGGDIEAIAGAVRERWGIRNGPIDNLTNRLENANCFVLSHDFGTDKMDESTLWEPPAPPIIMINSRVPGDRLRFSLAHALGHLVMHHRQPPYEDIEADAHEFAAAFLMPAGDIRPELQPVTIDHMLQLKKRWKVSIQALIRRAHDLEVISHTRYTSLFQMLSRYGYRKNEPVDIEPEKPVLVKELLSVFKSQGLTNAELAELTSMYVKDFWAMYYPELNLVE
jgi:Zn-dependent peptidase ImmA (M78 family)/transcriptional regulator with XRE-family HTH domain